MSKINIEKMVWAVPVGYEVDRVAAIKSAPPGLLLEMGTNRGRYIREMADICAPRLIWGFDSFEGMPEAWGPEVPKGAWACEPPRDLPANVCLVKGLFQDTLLPFLSNQNPRQEVAFVHYDADLYSSTIFCLNTMTPWLADRCLLMFDQVTDQFNKTPRETLRREHEGRAMQEWTDAHPELTIECIGRQKRDGAIFRILK